MLPLCDVSELRVYNLYAYLGYPPSILTCYTRWDIVTWKGNIGLWIGCGVRVTAHLNTNSISASIVYRLYYAYGERVYNQPQENYGNSMAISPNGASKN